MKEIKKEQRQRYERWLEGTPSTLHLKKQTSLGFNYCGVLENLVKKIKIAKIKYSAFYHNQRNLKICINFEHGTLNVYF